MITWMEGDFSISFVDEKYENYMDEDNQKILLDAIQYIDKRNKILESLPDLQETLLISPETDMEQMDADDVNYLKFFQGGQSIYAFLAAYDEDELKLLNVALVFVENQHLMNRKQFDSHTTEQERVVADSGLKTVFKKFFRSRDPKKAKKTVPDRSETAAVTDDGEEKIIPISKDEPRLKSLFQVNSGQLGKFRKAVEKI